MWIRSQGKEILINANMFFIESILSLNDEIEYGIKTISAANLRAILGTYSTKEKALKVLEMIGKELEKQNEEFFIKDGSNFRKRSNKNVFKMPEDCEVK